MHAPDPGWPAQARRELKRLSAALGDLISRAAYGRLTTSLVEAAPGDRLAYMAGKAAYVDALERRAVEWLDAAGGSGARGG